MTFKRISEPEIRGVEDNIFYQATLAPKGREAGRQTYSIQREYAKDPSGSSTMPEGAARIAVEQVVHGLEAQTLRNVRITIEYAD